MTLELNDDIKSRIIPAAFIAAGPKATDQEVAEQAARIAEMYLPGSPLLAAFDRVERRAESITGADTFVSTIAYVDRETTSGRILVMLKGKPSKNYPDGFEPMRTDSLKYGGNVEQIQALAGQATQLIGQKAVVTKRMEKSADGNGSNRVLTTLQGLEVDTEWEYAAQLAGLIAAGTPESREQARALGARLIDWSLPGKPDITKLHWLSQHQHVLQG